MSDLLLGHRAPRAPAIYHLRSSSPPAARPQGGDGNYPWTWAAQVPFPPKVIKYKYGIKERTRTTKGKRKRKRKGIHPGGAYW